MKLCSTPDELEAIALTADLVHIVCIKIIGRGPTRDQDINEFVIKIHGIQQSIMSQAAGRAHPDLLRLLGETIDS